MGETKDFKNQGSEFRKDIMVEGWASTICIVMFRSGIQLFCMGIIGQYIAKIYLETKHRPHFIVAETNSEDVVKVK